MIEKIEIITFYTKDKLNKGDKYSVRYANKTVNGTVVSANYNWCDLTNEYKLELDEPIEIENKLVAVSTRGEK